MTIVLIGVGNSLQMEKQVPGIPCMYLYLHVEYVYIYMHIFCIYKHTTVYNQEVKCQSSTKCYFFNR